MHSTTRALMVQRFVLAAAACLIVLALTPHVTLAKTTTWTNASPADDLWSNPGNWDNGIPSFFDIVYFDPIGSSSVQDIPGLDLQEMDMTGYMGTLILDQPLTLLGNLLVDGMLDVNLSGIDVGGDIAVVGILEAPGATVSVNGNLLVDGWFNGTSGAWVTVVGSVDVGYLATLDMGNSTLELEGNLTHDPAGASVWGGGLLRFQGSGTQQWDAGPSAKNYGNVEIAQGPGSVVLLVAPALTIEVGDLLVSSGSLEFYAGGLTVHGSTDIGPSGSLVNNASNTTMQFNGPVGVDGLFESREPACTLRFAPGPANQVDVGGTASFEVWGLPGLRTRLEQDGTSGGTQWILSHAPGAYLEFGEVDVQDSDAQPGGVTPAGNSTDLGNNTGWNFGPKATTWMGGGGTNNWSDAGNWNNGVPSSGDDVLFSPVGGFSAMDIPGLSLNSMDMTGFAGILDLPFPLDVVLGVTTSGNLSMPGSALSVGTDLTVYGSFDATSANILVGDYLWVYGALTAGGGALLTTDDFVAQPGSSIDFGNGTLELTGSTDFSGASGVLWNPSGTLRFNGAGTQLWLSSSSSSNFGNVEISQGGGSSVQLQSVVSVVHTNNLTVSGGTLELGVAGLEVNGDLDVLSGGSVDNSVSTGAIFTFHNRVTVDGLFGSTAGGCAFNFAGGTGGTVAVNGTATFDISGVPGNRTVLEQDGTAGGTQWFLDYDPSTTLTFNDVEVQDSDAQGAAPIVAGGTSIDNGNNDNWSFPAKTTTWIGGGITDNWSDPGNWNNGIPDTGDDVAFNAVGGGSILDIPGLILNSMDMTGYLGSLAVNHDFSTLGDLTFDGTVSAVGRTFAVGGDLGIEGDTDGSNTNWTVAGNIDIDGGFYMPDSFFDVDMSGAISTSGTLDLSGFAHFDVADDLTVAGALGCDNATVLVGGSLLGGGSATLHMGDAQLTVSGNLSVAGASSMTWTSGGTLRFDGSSSQSWQAGPGSTNYGAVEVANGGGGGSRVILSAGGGTNIHVNGLDITQGTLEIQSGDLYVNGNMTVSPGATFESLTNTNAFFLFSGLVTVNSGTFRSTASGCDLYFAAGAPGTVDLNGATTFNVSGLPGSRTTLAQDGTAGGTQWFLNYEPTVGLVFNDVEVQDSDAQGAGPAVAGGTSIDLGNNTNWVFPAKTTVWTNAGGTGLWSDLLNWDNGVPASGDNVHSTPVGGLSAMDIAGLNLDSMDMTGFSGTLRLDQDLDIAGHVTTAGTFALNNRSLNVGGDLDAHGVVDITLADLTVGGALHVTGDLDFDGGIVEAHGYIDGSPGATLGMGTGTLKVHDDTDLSNFSSVDIHPTGRLECLGSSDYDIDFGGSISTGHVWVQHSSPTTRLTVRSSGLLTVTGDLDVDTGTLDLHVGDVTINGDTSIRLDGKITGSINQNYKVDFDGHIEVIGDFVYTHGKVTATFKRGGSLQGTLDVDHDGSELRFAGGETFTVHPSGTMRVIGGGGVDRAKLLLDGAPLSDQWLLDVRPGATTQFENIDVQDSDASPGETCTANGECIDLGNNENWNFVGTAAGDSPPTSLAIRAAPNPFNPQTTIHYAVPSDGDVTIRIYDVRGALVRTLISRHHAQGRYEEPWQGLDDRRQQVGSGVYFCRIESSAGSMVEKLVLLK